MKKTAKLSLGIIILVCLSGFLVFKYASGNIPSSSVANNSNIPDRKIADLWNTHAVDSAVSLLRSGYIVLRLGQGADSYLLSQMNQKDKTYSHCGIVMIENGYPFVYHSIGGEDNPDQRLRRDSANFFFSHQHNMAFSIVRYDLATDKVDELRQVVYQYFRQRPRFDMQFDLITDDKIYCAELVYKAVNKAMHDTGYIRPTRFMGYTFVGIDDLFLNPHAHIVWQTKFK
ncbi:MAG: hypothetical protein JWQ38_1591 [Flavipsychrobacter sp.]|nr:hypothetical protein [Flavipsychrobacter sp.]